MATQITSQTPEIKKQQNTIYLQKKNNIIELLPDSPNSYREKIFNDILIYKGEVGTKKLEMYDMDSFDVVQDFKKFNQQVGKRYLTIYQYIMGFVLIWIFIFITGYFISFYNLKSNTEKVLNNIYDTTIQYSKKIEESNKLITEKYTEMDKKLEQNTSQYIQINERMSGTQLRNEKLDKFLNKYVQN